MIGLPNYAIEDWLKSYGTVAGHLAFDVLHYSREAIFYILRKYKLLEGMIIQAGIMDISNSLDKLAAVIDAVKKVAEKAAAEVKYDVMRLIRKIHAALGLAVNAITDITGDLLRWTMQRLEEALFKMVRTAVRGTLSV